MQPPDGTAIPAAPDGDPDVVRRVYGNAREWYTVAEAKAQLLLTVNGVFVTLVVGSVVGRSGDVRELDAGVETWSFLAVAALAVVGAVTCAALCMWSQHGAGARRDLARLGVDPGDGTTFRPEVLWYFGHLAQLDHDAAVEHLRRADAAFEVTALSDRAVDLARKVLRKHRFVNAGWALTALALVALTASTVSLVARARL